MPTGQCSVDPVTGVAGDIYNSWTGNGNAGLTAGATASGSTIRKLLAAQIEAIAASIVANGGTVNGHSLGATVAWASGSSAGQISFGAAAPNGTLGSATGCDEGGTITFTTGANTATGPVFVVHFAQAFPNAPAGMVFAADAATGTLMYQYQTYVTTTTAALTFNIASAPPNATYKLHWFAKGGT